MFIARRSSMLQPGTAFQRFTRILFTLSRATPSAASEHLLELIGFPISEVLHHVLRLFAVDEGGLISYGFKVNDSYKQAASFVDRILRGSKPDELPVQEPVKFQLIVNLNAAKSLGLVVPPFMQQRADRVIE
jgi:hypothetical protein